MSDSSRAAAQGLGHRQVVALVALAFAAILGVWAVLQRGDTASLDPVGPSSRPATEPAPSAAIGSMPASRPVLTSQRSLGGAPEPITNPALQKGMLKLPDGSYVAPLNGAVNPPALRFRDGRPWAPIVGKGGGTWPGPGYLEYYIHADGTKTFTFKSPITRSGVTNIESVTFVSHPDDSTEPKIPILAGEGEGPASGPGGNAAPPPRR